MYAELVCGPPGSGKSTYCESKRQFVSAASLPRNVITLNLDPGNDGIFPYPCDIDICDLVDHKEVMSEENLGPNGTYLYCIDYIALHLEWIQERIMECMTAGKFTSAADARGGVSVSSSGFGPSSEGNYYGEGNFDASRGNLSTWLLIDCPGQVEFYLHSAGMKSLVRMLQKTLRFEVCMIHLCDGTVATRDIATYVSTCLLTLSTMVDMELPQVNVLSKWDLVVAGAANNSMMAMKGHGATGRRAGLDDDDDKTDLRKRTKQNKGGKIKKKSVLMGLAEDSPSSEEEEGDSEMSGPRGIQKFTTTEEEIGNFLNTAEFYENHFRRMWKKQWLRRRMEWRNSLSYRPASSLKEDKKHCSYDKDDGPASPPPPPAAEIVVPLKEKEEERKEGAEEDHYSNSKLYKLSDMLMSVIDGYSLVSFVPLDVNDPELARELCIKVDGSVGCFESY